LEEKGIISKTEKGMIKDLIICGDTALMQALERLERNGGDKSEIKSILQRRGSIDLLENMDLDMTSFLGSPKEGGDRERSDTDVVGDYFASVGDFDDTDGIVMSEAIRQIRKASIDSNSGNMFGFGDVMQRNASNRSASIIASSSVLGVSGTEDASQLHFHSSVFDDQVHVELSAYENVAKALSASKPNMKAKNTKVHNSKQDSHSKYAGGSSNSALKKSNDMSSSSNNTKAPTSSGSDEKSSDIMMATIPAVALNQIVWTKRVEGGADGKSFIGAYNPEQRKKRIERFIEKRSRRVWTKKVKYDVRKNFADSRLRVKGRFVKKEDEEIMRELMTIDA
jgi:hypothetical protein